MGRELYLGVLVFLGAGTGGVMRHLFNKAVPLLIPLDFPSWTLIINILGCTLMGALTGWFTFRGEQSGQELRLLLTTGVLGGFTTFSAFSLDALLLWHRGAHGQAVGYVLASVILSLIGVAAGMALMRAVLH